MGWKGLVRSLNARARESARQEARQQRELIRQQRAAARLAMAVQGHQVVAQHEALVRQLVTVHLRGSPAWNWTWIAQQPAPPQPTYVAHHEYFAQQSLQAYTPSVTDRMLGRVEQQRGMLMTQIEYARHQDHAAHAHAMSVWQAQHQEWEWRTDLACGILNGELEAYRAALEYLFPFAAIPELCGLNLEVGISSVEATIQLESDNDIVPSEYPVQLKSGELSWKKMTATAYNELYQDYVCSCLLRVAWESFALLPVPVTLVHVTSQLLNTATGYLEPTIILSAAIIRDTLLRLNPERIDPSNALSNFMHNMKFNTRTGFRPVEALRAADLSRTI